MANSKFSGVGFASGQNSNSNSIVVGYESGQNRRWTLAELAAGLPGSTLQQVMNAGSISSVTNQQTSMSVISAFGDEARLNFGITTPGSQVAMQSLLSGGNSSFLFATVNGSSIGWSTQGVGNRTIEIGPSFMKVDDAVGNKGLEYDSDYSANFTARSLVDKAYVDSVAGTPTLQDVVNTGNVIRNVSGDTNIIKINDGNILQSIEIGGTGTKFGIEGTSGSNVNITTATGQSVTLGSSANTNNRINIFNDFGGFTDAIFEGNCNAQFKGKIKDYAGDEGTPNKALMISEFSGGGYIANSIRWKNPNGELILLPDTPDQDIYNDGNIFIKLNDLNTDDIQIQILTNPASGNVTFTWESNGASPTSGGNSINVSSGLTNANTDFDFYNIMRMTVYAPADTNYPYYEFVFTKGAGGTNFVTRVTKWDSIS